MNTELIVNVTDHETRVALIENGILAEIFIERGDETNITGNIYKGIVQRVLPGMQAAFVDINLDQAAFLYVDDVVGRKNNGDDHLGNDDISSDDLSIEDFDPETIPPKRPNAKIEDLITEGQEIMVQVVKSPIGSKGPRITTHISLPGRYLVLMPTVNHVGISRRIEDKDERSRLKDLILNSRQHNYGYISRTASEGISNDKLIHEMKLLENSWNNIKEKIGQTTAPCLLHKDLIVTLRAIRDHLIHDANKLIIDSYTGYKSVLAFIESIIPDFNVKVEYYDKPEPVFDYFNIENEINRALQKKVWLKSGGYIIIEHTEALVAIDVNTGRYIGRHNFEETVLKINLEAIDEIARQIRLRNIGGIIIIDFIDMEQTINKENVYNTLKEVLKKDKSKTSILPMSDMGLIQMTRKRVTKSLLKMMCEPCFYCEGNGLLLSRQTVCFDIFREIMRGADDILGNTIKIKVSPPLSDMLKNKEKNMIFYIENKFGKKIEIIPDNDFHIEEYDIRESFEK
ncbi:MAG: Rne/Rng family ribonuclease [Proteobacteria bacterium]|nr:Rne/Rng family ribonuclease [Pseudomonadota bacterium]